jgi:hypothetical protein
MQTDDMRDHPPVDAYRALCLGILSERREAFLSVLGKERYDDLVVHLRSLESRDAELKPPLHRCLVRDPLVRLLGEPAYAGLRLPLGRLIR